MQRSLRLLIAGLLLSAWVTTGCTSFRRDAKHARQHPPGPGSVEGLWEGRWYREDKPEHGGRTQLVLTRIGDQTYRASFRSQWWKVFRSGYDSMLVVTPVAPGKLAIQGSQDLWLFGGYTVTGRVDQARLDAVFLTGGHRGVLELRRPSVP